MDKQNDGKLQWLIRDQADKQGEKTGAAGAGGKGGAASGKTLDDIYNLLSEQKTKVLEPIEKKLPQQIMA